MSRQVLLGLAPAPTTYSEAGSRSATLDGISYDEAVSAAGAYTLVASNGAYDLVGGGVALDQIAARQVVLAGQPYPLIITDSDDRQVSFGNLVYSEATNAVAYSLTAERGIFTLSGQAADLVFSGVFEPDVGSFNLSGQDVNMRRGKRLVADVGSYGYNIASTLQRLEAFAGAFTLTGSAATLTYNSTSTKLIADGRVIALTGYPATLRLSRPLPAAVGVFTLTGGDATFAIGNRAITAEPGLYVLDGRPTSNALRAEGALYTFVGQDAGLTLNADTFWRRVEDVAETWTRVSN